MTIRTSITHPLCLDPLPVGTQGGMLGITLCPGKHAPSYNGPAWARDHRRPGGRAVVHCKGGLGRAGTIAARILIETGTAPAEAIRQVRGARGKDAIENARQERHVLALAPGARL